MRWKGRRQSNNIEDRRTWTIADRALYRASLVAKKVKRGAEEKFGRKPKPKDNPLRPRKK